MLDRYLFNVRVQLRLLVLIALLLNPSFTAAAEQRTWKAASGNFQVEAELIKQTTTEVILKKADGKEIRVRKDKLCAEDRQFLIQLVAKKTREEATQNTKDSSSKPLESKNESPAETDMNFAELPAASIDSKLSRFEWELPEVREEKGIDYEAIRQHLLEVPAPPVWEEVIQFEADIEPATAILSDDGRFLLTHDAKQKTITVWDIEEGTQHHQWKCDELSNPQCLAISPKGKYLAIGSSERVVVTYDVENSKELYRHKALKSENDTPYRVALSWLEDDVYFQGEESGTVFRFPVEGGVGGGLPIKIFPPKAEDTWGMLQVSPDGNTVNFKLAPGKLVMREIAIPKGDAPPPMLRGDVKEVEHHPIVSHAMNGGFILYADRLSGERFNFIYKDYGKFPAPKMQSLSTLIRSTPHLVSMDQKQEHIWTWGPSLAGDFVVEICQLDIMSDPITLLPPIAVQPHQGDKVWLSAEGRRWVRWDAKQRKIQVFRLANLEYPPTWKIPLEIIRALRERRFDRVDGIVKPWLRSNTKIPGGSQNTIIHQLIGRLVGKTYYETRGANQARLQAWQTIKPDSALARLVVASMHIGEGFDARGDGRANTVTKEGWTIFKREAEMAQDLLTHLMEQEEPPPSAFLLQLRVAMMQGWEVEKQYQLADRLLKLHPEFTPFHRQMVVNLLPRWYGEPGESMKYAERVAKFLGTEKGELQYAYMASMLADYHPPQLVIDEAKVDPQRVFDAYRNQWKKDPRDPFASFLALSWAQYIMVATVEKNIPSAQQMSELFDHVTQELTRIDWNIFAAAAAFGNSNFLDNRTEALRARKKP